jgi:hypothetical protein
MRRKRLDSRLRGNDIVGIDAWVEPTTNNCQPTTGNLGLFDDEPEAAKAYELAGEYAYLNFPEDFERK